MPTLTVSLLGEFTVSQNGHLITEFSYDKVRALLAYLIAQAGTPIRREQLIGLLWAESSEDNARRSLSQALFTLRTLLDDRTRDPVFIHANRQTIEFDSRAPYSLDVADFELHTNAVETHQHNDIASCESCMAHMEAAVTLYRDDFLQGVSVDDSIAFEEWAILLRENLRRRAIQTLEQLSQVYLVRKQYSQANATAQRLIDLDSWNESAYRSTMQALALDGQRNLALAHYETCRALLDSEFGVTPEPATTLLYESILDGTLTSPIADGDVPPAPGSPPFPGLRYFDVGDARLYFGREQLVQRILTRLNEGEDFLAIIGASGSGKSSLVRAGVVAALQELGEYTIHIITPTAAPVTSLCSVLCRAKSAQPSLRESMLDSPAALAAYLQESRETPPLLLVIDQFEELFTLCYDDKLRSAFIENLLNAVQQAGLMVIITLRADYYHHCAEHELLRQAVESHQLYIGAMRYEELLQAIELPAKANAWDFEAGLVDLLLKDVGAAPDRLPEPGALPLLSHALLETWMRRQGRTLTLKGYAEAGGVRGAIALSAEAVYQAFPPEQQRIARMIFLRLTEFGDEYLDEQAMVYTRRRINLDEIQPAPEMASTTRSVLDKLATARLITMQLNAVEVAHEALIREWPTLREWLNTDQDRLRAHRHLTEAAHAWEERNRDPADLYRAARLAQIEEWPAEAQQELSALEREFIDASREEESRIARAREAQRQRELKLAHDRAEERGRLLRWIGLTAAILFVAVIGAVVLGWGYRNTSNENANLAVRNAEVAAENAQVAATARASETEALAAQERESEQRAEAQRLELEAAEQRDIAQEQAQLNLAMSLASQAAMNQEKNSDLALLLALEANSIVDSATTRGALMTTLDHSPGKVHYLSASRGIIQSLSLSADGRILISTQQRNLLLWDITRDVVIAEIPADEGTTIFYHANTNETGLLAVLYRKKGDSPYVKLFDIKRTPEAPQYLATVSLEDYSSGIESYIGLSPDGRYLASTGCEDPYWTPSQFVFCTNAIVQLRDLQPLLEGDGEAVLVHQLITEGEAYNLEYSPGGESVALAGCRIYDGDDCQKGFTLLWDTTTGEASGVEQGEFTIGSDIIIGVAYSPDGAFLATGGCAKPYQNSEAFCDEVNIDIWELETFTHVSRYVASTKYDVRSLVFGPDSQTLAFGTSDVIYLWEPGSATLLGNPIVGHTGSIADLVFSPDGQTLYSGGEDAKIGIWDLSQRGGIGERLAVSLPAAQMDLAPDGRTLAVPTMGGIDIRDTTSGELVQKFYLDRPDFMLWSVAYSPDGLLLASSGYSDGAIILWDVETGEKVASPVYMDGSQAFGVDFSPDGSLLATSGVYPEIYVWDVASFIAGDPVSRTFSGHELRTAVPQVVFSPDGSLLASGGNDYTVGLWDVATGKAEAFLEGHEDFVYTVAFSPDGSLLASGGEDSTVRLWDVATRTSLAELKGHTQAVWRMAFTSDGNTLASYDAYGVLRLWDMRDPLHLGQPIGETLPSQPGYAWGLTITPDNQYAFTSAVSGELYRWQLDPAVWRERACTILDRDLTSEEWAFYLPGQEPTVTCP